MRGAGDTGKEGGEGCGEQVIQGRREGREVGGSLTRDGSTNVQLLYSFYIISLVAESHPRTAWGGGRHGR